MPAVEETIVINAPIDQVFRALTDPFRGPEWNRSIVDVSGVPADWASEGATWEQTVMMGGWPMRLKCRVARYQPPYRGEIEVSGDQRGHVWTDCRPVEDGVQVTQGIDFEPPGGLLGRVAGGMIAPAIRRELQQTIQRQRAMLEREFGGTSRTPP